MKLLSREGGGIWPCETQQPLIVRKVLIQRMMRKMREDNVLNYKPLAMVIVGGFFMKRKTGRKK